MFKKTTKRTKGRRLQVRLRHAGGRVWCGHVAPSGFCRKELLSSAGAAVKKEIASRSRALCVVSLSDLRVSVLPAALLDVAFLEPRW